jgi:hypothetical protein
MNSVENIIENLIEEIKNKFIEINDNDETYLILSKSKILIIKFINKFNYQLTNDIFIDDISEMIYYTYILSLSNKFITKVKCKYTLTCIYNIKFIHKKYKLYYIDFIEIIIYKLFIKETYLKLNNIINQIIINIKNKLIHLNISDYQYNIDSYILY